MGMFKLSHQDSNPELLINSQACSPFTLWKKVGFTHISFTKKRVPLAGLEPALLLGTWFWIKRVYHSTTEACICVTSRSLTCFYVPCQTRASSENRTRVLWVEVRDNSRYTILAWEPISGLEPESPPNGGTLTLLCYMGNRLFIQCGYAFHPHGNEEPSFITVSFYWVCRLNRGSTPHGIWTRTPEGTRT